MERAEFVAILEPLRLALRADFDKATWGAYYHALKDVSAPLLLAVREQMMRETREFFPKTGELRAACERRRRVLLAENPYDGCAECQGFPGYRTVNANNGLQPTVERCPCKGRYLEKLERLGLRESLGDLPGEAGVGENERVYPTLEELPTSIRQQLQHVANRKQLQ